MMKKPPIRVDAVIGSLLNDAGSSWSIIATMKIVKSAATEDSTGDVRLMRIKNDPENTNSSASSVMSSHLPTFDSTLMAIIQACSPRGNSKTSQPE